MGISVKAKVREVAPSHTHGQTSLPGGGLRSRSPGIPRRAPTYVYRRNRLGEWEPLAGLDFSSALPRSLPRRRTYSLRRAAVLILMGFLPGATSIVFEADADGDGRVERIEYRMAADGTSLIRRASPKRLGGSLGAPTSDNQSFIQNLTNQTLADPLPVFSWEVDPDSSELFPNNISIVYVSLAIEARLDPRDPSKKKIFHLAGASRRLNPSR